MSGINVQNEYQNNFEPITDEVKQIIYSKPFWLVRYGFFIVSIFLLLLLLYSYFYSYNERVILKSDFLNQRFELLVFNNKTNYLSNSNLTGSIVKITSNTSDGNIIGKIVLWNSDSIHLKISKNTSNFKLVKNASYNIVIYNKSKPLIYSLFNK